MFKEHSKKNGVSAIVGGLIILAILFTMIIPLIILIQNSYAIFLNESNSRRIFDTERISESLQVEVSQNSTTKDLILVLSNDGPVYIEIVRVWAIDTTRQTSLPINKEGACLSGNLLELRPGKNDTLNIQQCVNGFTGIAQFLVVTERGRIFSSNRVNLTSGRLVDIIFPYTLTISIMNMKRGAVYEVRVEALGEGNISPEKFTHKATASNENVTVAFGATAGRYKVSLYENDKPANIKGNPTTVSVPDVTSVIFDLGKIKYQPVPLDIIISAPRKVFAPQGDEESFSASIWVQLPRDALEPVDIIKVDTNKIQLSGPPNIIEDIMCYSRPGFTLQPGERAMTAWCTITVKGAGKVGETYDITINVDYGTVEGKGFYSSLTYTNNMASLPLTVKIRSK